MLTCLCFSWVANMYGDTGCCGTERGQRECVDIPCGGGRIKRFAFQGRSSQGMLRRNQMECTQAVAGGCAFGTVMATGVAATGLAAKLACPGAVAAGAVQVEKVPYVGHLAAHVCCPLDGSFRVGGASIPYMAVAPMGSAAKNGTLATTYNMTKGYVEEDEYEFQDDGKAGGHMLRLGECAREDMHRADCRACSAEMQALSHGQQTNEPEVREPCALEHPTWSPSPQSVAATLPVPLCSAFFEFNCASYFEVANLGSDESLVRAVHLLSAACVGRTTPASLFAPCTMSHDFEIVFHDRTT
mmetsp:Transcript_154532/g.495386  ORF Transcript_154532/g.495386 Transcript_154532/m.495386 type:complete len:300 (-) Transcript_154532:87-986(-)